MPTKKFVRRDSHRYAKLGKNRKKKQVWRKPKGRDSQTRLKRRGYPSIVSIGYSSKKSEAGKIKGLYPVLVCTERELVNIDAKTQAALLSGKIGAKRKLELIKKAAELKISVLNLIKEKSKEAKK